MRPEVRWTEPAEDDMRRLDRQTAHRVRQAIVRFAETGYGDVKLLRGTEREWRLRVGEWRVRFTRNVDENSIIIQRVLPRGRAYRG